MAKLHTHPCEFQKAGCTNVIECDGEYQPNVDGFPESVCDFYHLNNGAKGDRACDACSDSCCDECGCIVRLEGHDKHCTAHDDNREPPEPDGECFRGGEAAAFEADRIERVQRELKR